VPNPEPCAKPCTYILQVRNATFRRMEKSNAFNNLLGMVLDDGQRECRCLVCNRAFADDEELGAWCTAHGCCAGVLLLLPIHSLGSCFCSALHVC
jgi:hypothetical protein